MKSQSSPSQRAELYSFESRNYQIFSWVAYAFAVAALLITIFTLRGPLEVLAGLAATKLLLLVGYISGKCSAELKAEVSS